MLNMINNNNKENENKVGIASQVETSTSNGNKIEEANAKASANTSDVSEMPKTSEKSETSFTESTSTTSKPKSYEISISGPKVTGNNNMPNTASATINNPMETVSESLAERTEKANKTVNDLSETIKKINKNEKPLLKFVDSLDDEEKKENRFQIGGSIEENEPKTTVEKNEPDTTTTTPDVIPDPTDLDSEESKIKDAMDYLKEMATEADSATIPEDTATKTERKDGLFTEDTAEVVDNTYGKMSDKEWTPTNIDPLVADFTNMVSNNKDKIPEERQAAADAIYKQALADKNAGVENALTVMLDYTQKKLSDMSALLSLDDNVEYSGSDTIGKLWDKDKVTQQSDIAQGIRAGEMLSNENDALVTKAITDAMNGQTIDVDTLKSQLDDNTVENLRSFIQEEKTRLDEIGAKSYNEWQDKTLEEFKNKWIDLSKGTGNEAEKAKFWQDLSTWAIAAERATGDALRGYANPDVGTNAGFLNKNDFVNAMLAADNITMPDKSTKKASKSAYDYQKDVYDSKKKEYESMWKDYMNDPKTAEYYTLSDANDKAYALATFAAQKGASINGVGFSNKHIIEFYGPRAVKEDKKAGFVNGVKQIAKDLGDGFGAFLSGGPVELASNIIEKVNAVTESENVEFEQTARDLYYSLKDGYDYEAKRAYDAVSSDLLSNKDVYTSKYTSEDKINAAGRALLALDGAYEAGLPNKLLTAANEASTNIAAYIYYTASGNDWAAKHAMAKADTIMAAYFPEEAQEDIIKRLSEIAGISLSEETEELLNNVIEKQIETESEIDETEYVEAEDDEIINAIHSKAQSYNDYGEWNRGLEDELRENIKSDELLRKYASNL